MKLIEMLIVALIISILASIGLPVITKAYDRMQWHLFLANARNNGRIEAALIDEPNRFDEARFEFLLSTPMHMKGGQ